MKEIKCPNCGSVFTVDESDYAEIVAQVRGAEFDREISERAKALAKEKDTAVEMAVAKKESELKEAIYGKQTEIEKLQGRLDSELLKKEAEIEKLRAELKAGEDAKKLAVREALEGKDKEIAERRTDIVRLQGMLDTQAKEIELKEKSQKAEFDAQLKAKDEEIAFYKDFKARQSTKMIGESLEQHCSITFNQIRATAFPNAYFEKDNDARTGSKGDFIFKDFTGDGTEFLSIMFEMKNEADTTATKHKNEDFYKELDKDRCEKGCEYAVLVSLLEPDNELFNGGIVNVSHRYPKMYVVRPQFFIPIISLLREGALRSIDYQRQLAEIKSQNIDLENFEKEMNTFKSTFGNNFRLAVGHYEKAIDSIDKTIKSLEKTRDELQASMKQLNWANDKAEDLNVKSLTKNSPLLREKFEEMHKED